MKKNPYITALVVLTLGAAAIGGIFLLVGAGEASRFGGILDAPGKSAFDIAAAWIQAAGLFLMVTLLAGAITWRRPTA